MQEKISEKTNQPQMKFSAGNIKATVWTNHAKNKSGEETEFSTITLERVYKDKEDQWQSTNVFRIGDLPKAAALINKAYENIVVREA
ncbi:hypothetical protein GOV05_03845 [Candidatus Woesearchaeota archaeon]|nr:hypothetical protein [Candidatus Woesearchaeota archaeon]